MTESEKTVVCILHFLIHLSFLFYAKLVLYFHLYNFYAAIQEQIYEKEVLKIGIEESKKTGGKKTGRKNPSGKGSHGHAARP